MVLETQVGRSMLADLLDHVVRICTAELEGNKLACATANCELRCLCGVLRADTFDRCVAVSIQSIACL